MSDDTRQVESHALPSRSALDVLEDWYHVPVLAAVFAFMVWVRAQSYERFIRGGEVFFSGNDAWYHFREVMYLVQNYPRLMPFDPWTGFPVGTSVGQFGTLYDQLVATAALVVGLGDPSTQTVATVLLFTPPVLAGVTAIPTYFIGKRLGGRFAGVFSAVILALLPGMFLNRGLIGAADHNIAEPLFQSLAVLAMMVAVTVAERERPVYEQAAAREFGSLRRPLVWSVLAGIATALYLWVWPPAVVIVVLFGAVFMLKLAGDYVRGVSPDHLAFVAVVSMTVTGLLSLVPLGALEFTAVAPTLLQPALAFGLAFGAAFMAWLGREWDGRGADVRLYPVAIAAILVAAVGVVWVAVPNLFTALSGNLGRMFYFFGQSAAAGTVAEAQTTFVRASRANISVAEFFFSQYGMAFFVALAGAAWAFTKAMVSDDEFQLASFGAAALAVVAVLTFSLPYEPFVVIAAIAFLFLVADLRTELMLVLAWFFLISVMALTQLRFHYYLVVPVAVLNGYVLREVISFLGATDVTGQVRDVEWYQVFAVVAVLLFVLLPFLAPVAVSGQSVPNAMENGKSARPGAVTAWDEPLQWMQNNTPEEGTFGGANNEMAYYGTYANTDDFAYPEGAYGVMSWWDYGHWITVEGERIPVANPFQQHAAAAANFLLAPNETQARDVLSDLGEEGENTRYVMVDWQMVHTQSKFGAPTVFYTKGDVNGTGDFYRPYFRGNNQQGYSFGGYIKKQRYYESLMVRLYRYHGSAAQPSNMVVNYDVLQPQGPNGQSYWVTPQGDQFVKRFNTSAETEAYLQNDSSAVRGGLGRRPAEYVPALEHYRLVKASEARPPTQLMLQGFHNAPAWVKTFERVPGATVQGEGPANATVTASVRMFSPAANSTFTYTQRAQTGSDGAFEMTLPYSTTGYENWGPENGYTNVSVRATGPYTFSTPVEYGGEGNLTGTQYRGTANVTEAQVIGESNETVQVTLEQKTVDEPEGKQAANGTANNSTTNASALAPPVAPGGDAPGVSASLAGNAGASDDLTASGPVGDAVAAERTAVRVAPSTRVAPSR